MEVAVEAAEELVVVSQEYPDCRLGRQLRMRWGREGGFGGGAVGKSTALRAEMDEIIAAAAGNNDGR